MTIKVKTSYKLPPLVGDLQTGWQTTFQSAATVSALLAAVEGQLFVFIEAQATQTPPPYSRSSASGQALLCFTYLTFLLSVGATVSSLTLTDQVGELPIRAAAREQQLDEVKGTGIKIMMEYGLSGRWGWFMWHWALMLILGYLCLLIQILIYVWLTQTRLIRALVSVATAWILLPLICFVGPDPAARREKKSGEYGSPMRDRGEGDTESAGLMRNEANASGATQNTY